MQAICYDTQTAEIATYIFQNFTRALALVTPYLLRKNYTKKNDALEDQFNSIIQSLISHSKSISIIAALANDTRKEGTILCVGPSVLGKLHAPDGRIHACFVDTPGHVHILDKQAFNIMRVGAKVNREERLFFQAQLFLS